jgi:hypothetical protein
MLVLISCSVLNIGLCVSVFVSFICKISGLVTMIHYYEYYASPGYRRLALPGAGDTWKAFPEAGDIWKAFPGAGDTWKAY